MQNSHIQKNTRRTCIKHFVCITLLNYFCDKYPPLNHHHQSRHHRSVQNLSLRHNFFKKFHHSIQLHTPTDPSIRLMPHVLWVRHHERGFYLQYHHSNSQYPTFHCVLGFVVTFQNLHMGFCWFLSIKNLFNPNISSIIHLIS
jgi:hypothetical protein